MRRLGIITFVAVVVAAIAVTPVTFVKNVTVDVPSIGQLATVTSQPTPVTQQALAVWSTLSGTVPAFAWSNACAFDWGQCDPSDGRHSALAYSCFLMWLMEVFDASNSPY